jgi:hypothetical protein
MYIHQNTYYSGGCSQARAAGVAASGSASGKQIYIFQLKLLEYIEFNHFLAMLIGESSAGPSNTRQSGEGKNYYIRVWTTIQNTFKEKIFKEKFFSLPS